MAAVAAAAAAGDSACGGVTRRWRAARRVDGAARWRRVDGMARGWRVDGAREEGRRKHDELGPALAAARRRWARWAMVLRCAIPRRVREEFDLGSLSVAAVADAGAVAARARPMRVLGRRCGCALAQ